MTRVLKTDSPSAKKPLVYGVFYFHDGSDDGMIVFFIKRAAVANEKLWKAAQSAKTWGDLKKKVSQRTYDLIAAEFERQEEKRPRAHEYLDKNVVSPYSTEYSPLDDMVDFLPDFIIALGQRADTPGMGDWVSFRPAQEKEVVERLRSAGWRIDRDDQLVRNAAFNWIEENFA